MSDKAVTQCLYSGVILQSKPVCIKACPCLVVPDLVNFICRCSSLENIGHMFLQIDVCTNDPLRKFLE